MKHKFHLISAGALCQLRSSIASHHCLTNTFINLETKESVGRVKINRVVMVSGGCYAQSHGNMSSVVFRVGPRVPHFNWMCFLRRCYMIVSSTHSREHGRHAEWRIHTISSLSMKTQYSDVINYNPRAFRTLQIKGTVWSFKLELCHGATCW